MEQHNKFTSLLPAKAPAIEKTYPPVKQEQTHTLTAKNCKQEATTSRIQFKQENSMDAYDSDENLLEILENSRPDHIDNDMDPMSNDPNDYDSSEDKNEEKQDEDVELVDEEYNALEANEFEEEHLEEEPAEATEYAYEPQAYENEYFKSLQADRPKPARKYKQSKNPISSNLNPLISSIKILN